MSMSKPRPGRSCRPPASLAMPLRLQSSNPRRLQFLAKAQRTARRRLKRNRCQVPRGRFRSAKRRRRRSITRNDAATLCGKRREPRSRRFLLYRLFVFLQRSNVNCLRLRIQDNKVGRAARRSRGNVMQKMLSDLGLYSKRTRGAGFFTTLAVFAVTIGTAAGQDSGPPKLHTNEAYVEEVTQATTLAVNDPMAVFAFVFNSLPDRVKVYPTENYYYFTFVHNGKSYDGNIRLDASTRDDGKVDFAYSEDLKEWLDETPVQHVLLDASKGVVVEKVERLVYRITYGQK